MCIAAAARGVLQRGVVHSAFAAAANILFPDSFMLSLNAAHSIHMPNGLQLSAATGSLPFSALRPGMPVLFGAQRLLIEATNCSLDLSMCAEWNPHIQRPAVLDMEIVKRNGKWLVEHLALWHSPCVSQDGLLIDLFDIYAMARCLCGRGIGLTPTGDDILAGWMAVNWLLHGSAPALLEACQHIMLIARLQTHILSQCWLGYAAEGNVALPIKRLLEAITRDDTMQLKNATQAVLAMGATSGRDVMQGILLGLVDVQKHS
ncbi:MAG: hypothetical protein NVSMB33_10290 [Ktedonobacteraceae bacterium]